MNPIINTGAEIQVNAIPTCKGDPCGWGDLTLELDPASAKLFDPEILKTGFTFGLLPVKGAWGKVMGRIVCLENGKPFLNAPFSFDLVILPGKVRPDGITTSVQLSSATDVAVGG